MKVTLERLPEGRVQLDIEVDNERLERSIDRAYKQVASRSRIPGFRPGKAPRNVVERLYGREGLIREALDKLVPDVYNEAIEAEDVDAIDQPELEIVEIDPVRFKATVPVRPTVDLGEYKAVRLAREPVEVTDEEVAEQVLLLRRRNATQSPVERPAQWDDWLIGDVSGKVEDESFMSDEDAEFQLREGQELLLPGLAEAFIGMSKGDTKTVEFTLPDEFPAERLQGKQATFDLHIKEVKEELLPEEDDDLASLVNADEFENLAALKTRIHDDLLKSKEAAEESAFQTRVIDAILEGATIEYPRILVEREIDHLIQDSLGANTDRQAYLTYLQRAGRSEEEFRETFREAAERRVRTSLVLSQFADDEEVEITEADVEAELDTIVAPMGDDADRFREFFATPEAQESIRRNLLTRKTLERITAIATGDAAEVSE